MFSCTNVICNIYICSIRMFSHLGNIFLKIESSNIVKCYYSKTTVFYFLYILKCNSFMWQRLFFSSHYANLESHDHMILQLSNMLANMYLFFLSVSKTPVRVNILWKPFFFGFFDKYKAQKNNIYLRYIFFLTMEKSLLTLDQFDASC